MEPTPSYMLKMTASHEQHVPGVTDGFGNPTYSAAVTLTTVSIELKRRAEPGAYGDQAKFDATLLYDCRNSRPAGRSFAELDRVTFEGGTYAVRYVDETRDPFTGALVFLEVRLAGA